MSGVNYRARYLQDSIGTASPGKLLTMLYDRLVLDLNRAETAQRESSREEASAALLHAQEVVLELHSTLDPARWEGGPALSAVYVYLLAELVRANTTGDPSRTAACRALVEPLRDAWHQAAAQQPATPAR